MRKFLLLVFMVVVLIAGFRYVSQASDQSSYSNNGQSQNGFDKKQFSLDDPTSPWVVVNKQRPLSPLNYAPADLTLPKVPLRVPNGAGVAEMHLRQETAKALEDMFAAAQADNLTLLLTSGHRTYAYQKGLYERYVRTKGQASADAQSARAGHSEHQTGLAVDVGALNRKCEVQACFADMPEGKWLADNAHRYGFIIRYLPNTQGITGYIYEPWHLRYVGKTLAEELHRQGNPTLEEFFDLGPASTYNQ